jgi:hypothetical protein
VRCYISVDNIPQLRLQVYFKILNRCQALNYLYVTQKLQIISVGMIKIHPRTSSFICFASNWNLNTDFGSAPHYSATEIKMRMSNFLKEICIFFNISIICIMWFSSLLFYEYLGSLFQREGKSGQGVKLTTKSI